MVTITHTDVHELADEEVRIPAGGRWMEMDWELVAAAFQAANKTVGWDVEIRLTPERQHALVLFSAEQAELVGKTMSDFYRVIEAQIGVEQFMSIWIDFGSRRWRRV
jgi:hypothetical protein